MKNGSFWNKQWCILGMLLSLGVLFAVNPVSAADLTVSGDAGQQTLADGDTLTVQGTGAVAVDNDDAEAFAEDVEDTYLDINVTAVKGDEESIFVTNGAVTVDEGGSITAKLDADTVDLSIIPEGSSLDEFYARAIDVESGDITITNAGTLTSVATSVAADDDIHAFTIQIRNVPEDPEVLEDPEVPATTIINTGAINATATSLFDSTYARGIHTCDSIEGLSIDNSGTITVVSESRFEEAYARGIKIGEYSNGTITNSGTIEVTATNDDDDAATAWGIQGGSDSEFTITNTADGIISVSAISDGYEAKAWGIKLGDQDDYELKFAPYSITNQGLISVSASGADETKAIAIQFESGGTVTNAGSIEANIDVLDDSDVDYSRAIGIFAAEMDDDNNPVLVITNEAGATISVNADYMVYGDVDDNPGAIGIKVSDGYIYENNLIDETVSFSRTVTNAGEITTTSTIVATEDIEDNAGAIGIKAGQTDARNYYGSGSVVTSELYISNTGTILADTILDAYDIDDNTGAIGIKVGETEARNSSNSDSTTTAVTDISNAGEISVSSAISADYIYGPVGAYGIRAGQAYGYNYNSPTSTAAATVNISNSGTITADTVTAATEEI